MKTETICPEPSCDYGIAERPRYFPRQLITPDIMTLEQEYFRNKLRRHNRLMHGWGVVCGALVCPVPCVCGTNSTEPWKVVVKSGYILGPYGDEIIIDCDRVVDLRTRGVAGVCGEPCVEPVDPWCSEVYVKREATSPLYVAVKYKECLARPVRVQPVGCGCDETQCEYSRLRDGYEICVLTCCPEADETPPEQFFTCELNECPPCPTDPWVVLAEVQFGDDGTITKIDNCSCRRIMVSFANYWCRCVPMALQITGVTSDSEEINPGQSAQLTITGNNFKSGLHIYLGQGVTVGTVTVNSAQEVKVSITVNASAKPGARVLTVTNPDCSVAVFPNAITIEEQAAPIQPAPAPRRKTRRPADEEENEE